MNKLFSFLLVSLVCVSAIAQPGNDVLRGPQNTLPDGVIDGVVVEDEVPVRSRVEYEYVRLADYAQSWRVYSRIDAREKVNTKSTNTNTTKALPQNNDTTDEQTSSTAAVVNQQHKNSQPIIKDKRRPLILLGEKPRGMYECDYCGSDITRAPRIRCADCPDFDLCLECFAIEDHHHMNYY